MFATLLVPKFSLQVAQRQEPELCGRCVALLNDALPPRVVEVSWEAEAQGVGCGMSSAQAQGRCPELIFRRVGEVTITPARDCLLQCAGTFSPWLEETAEGIVTMEWRMWQAATETHAPTNVAEMLQDALEKMVSQIDRFGFAATAGAAANPDLAILLARCARPVLVALDNVSQFLAPLPLETLIEVDVQSSEDEKQELMRMLHLLQRWGIRNLGQLTALSKAQLIERLGLDAGALWDRAAGRSTRLLKLVRVPERFVEVHEFECGVETLEPLLFILRRFVEQLSRRVEALHRVAAALLLKLRFDRSAPHEHEMKVPSPTADVEVLFRMISTHLEGVSAGSPVIAVELEIKPTPPQRSQFDLFSSRLRDPNQFYETLARLAALLGSERVGTPVALDTYRPDALRMDLPRFDEPSTAVKGEEPLRSGVPLRRCRPRHGAHVKLQSGYPVFVESDLVRGVVADARGPWLCSGEWWTTNAWVRVEWDVQINDMLCRLANESGSWFVEGIYD